MQIHHHISQLPLFRNAVITIGSFDGVHTGHKQILKTMTDIASTIHGETIVISFDPHPRQVLEGDATSIMMLSSLEEKSALLRELGINHLVLVPFTNEFALMTAENYIESFLFDLFHPHTIVVGYNHKFGLNRAGDFNLLRHFGNKLGFNVVEMPEWLTQSVHTSSSAIRSNLRKGDIQLANDLLGYAYSLNGIVVQGDQIGRQLGFPTANLQIIDTNKLIPADGVYIVSVLLVKSNTQHYGIMNIGHRPTFNGKDSKVEVNIFEMNDDIYHQQLTVRLLHRLRSEQKFEHMDQLIEQIGKDRSAAMDWLLNHRSA